MLWGCSMVCIGKNIANCSKNPQFLPVMCALCLHCARAVHTRPPQVSTQSCAQARSAQPPPPPTLTPYSDPRAGDLDVV